MSHSTVLVITRPGQDPEEALKPFDEGLEVEPYEKECYCAEDNLHAAVREVLNKEFGGDFNTVFRTPYQALSAADRPTWVEHIKPYKDRQEELEAKLAHERRPSPTCETCHGTGLTTTTYNPKSRWDWYQLGGRWVGYFKAKEDRTFSAMLTAKVGEPGLMTEPNKDLLRADQMRYQDIDWETMRQEARVESEKLWAEYEAEPDKAFIYGIDANVTKEQFIEQRSRPCTFAILTKEGEWLERGHMGWFGMASNEKDADDWEDEWWEIVSKCEPDDVLSVYDVHI